MAESRKLRVFLCHSSHDKPAVRELYQKLQAEGWIDPWLDEEKLLPGQDWEYEIEKALDHSDAVIVSLSRDSVTKEGYVQRELRFVIDIALEKPEGTIFILPLRLEECEPPRKLRTYHYADFFPMERRKWAYEKLLQSLKLRCTSLGISAPTGNVQIKDQKDLAPSKPRTKRNKSNLPEENALYNVLIGSVGPNNIQVIKVIREILNLSLIEAKLLAETQRPMVLRHVNQKAAQEARKKLEEAGASVIVNKASF